MLARSEIPSARKATPSTIQPTRNRSTLDALSSSRIASAIEKQPPIRNEKIAARKAQRKRVPP